MKIQKMRHKFIEKKRKKKKFGNAWEVQRIDRI